uniref:Conserved oligomeric Golgi complex subunit 7 n=1 Tax=Amblyomma triste TaxID=251400 RepID=A0A023GLZ0_AMBTT
MNLSAFSNENFDAKEWINNTFRAPEAQENKEAYASEVAFKLQLFIQEMNSALEETAQQVQQNLPRVLREVETMQQEAALLKLQMAAVQKDIAKVEQDSSTSMRTLLELDTIKLRMLDANKALREADNWTTLSADVDQVFQSGDVQVITERLVGLQTSLDILVDVPDYEQRLQKLESLKNQLEAMLSPLLVRAFTTQSIEAAKPYVRIFSDIQRMPQLLKYYHNCHRNRLVEAWRKIVESESDDTFLEWLNNFYDILVASWHSQVTWCNQVFPDPPAVFILSDVVVDAISNLDPSLQFCLEAAMKQQNGSTVYLTEVIQVSEQLCKSLGHSISTANPDLMSSPHVVALMKSVFSMFHTHLENYDKLEEKCLLGELSLVPIQSDDIRDSVTLLSDSVLKVFGLAKEAEKRCSNFLHGCSYPELLKSIKALFRAYFERCQAVLVQLKSTSKQDELDSWTMFQYALKCMQTAGDISLQLGAFDRSITANIKTALKQLHVQRSPIHESDDKKGNILNDHVSLLLSSVTQRNLRDFATQVHLEDFVAFPESMRAITKLCAEFTKFTFDTVFAEVQRHFSGVPSLKVWSLENPEGVLATDLPAFSISPMEYITQIGQYLLTIPQHIEPFIVEENEALSTALQHSNLPHVIEGISTDHVADYLLGCVAQATMYTYIDTVMQIERLTRQASAQLATDISYLCNVLDDLGLPPLESLQHLAALLKSPPEKFAAVAVGKPNQLVQTVRMMRGIR